MTTPYPGERTEHRPPFDFPSFGEFTRIRGLVSTVYLERGETMIVRWTDHWAYHAEQGYIDIVGMVEQPAASEYFPTLDEVWGLIEKGATTLPGERILGISATQDHLVMRVGTDGFSRDMTVEWPVLEDLLSETGRLRDETRVLAGDARAALEDGVEDLRKELVDYNGIASAAAKVALDAAATAEASAGEAGMSAFEVAVKRGFKGTEEEWLASLRGPKGDKGKPGDQGDPGPPGEDGTSVTITGTVTNSAELPTGLKAGDAGQGIITSEDGHLHVWSGTEWTDVGTVRGPKGDKGEPGKKGDAGPPRSWAEILPSGGIPAADLAEPVRERLNAIDSKADKTTVEQLTANQVSRSEITALLDAKANAADVTAGLGSKLDKDEAPTHGTPVASKLVRRTSDAMIQVPEVPSHSLYAASKKYVDDAVAAAAGSGGGSTEAVMPTPNTVAKRDSGGRLEVAPPTGTTHAATKKYVDDSIADMPTGGLAASEVSVQASANKIIRRDSSGRAEVGAPTGNTHAATKLYVDQKFASVPQDTPPSWSTSGVVLRDNGTINLGGGNQFIIRHRIDRGVFELFWRIMWGSNPSSGGGDIYMQIPQRPLFEATGTGQLWIGEPSLTFQVVPFIRAGDNKMYFTVPGHGATTQSDPFRIWDGRNGAGTGRPNNPGFTIDRGNTTLSGTIRFPV